METNTRYLRIDHHRTTILIDWDNTMVLLYQNLFSFLEILPTSFRICGIFTCFSFHNKRIICSVAVRAMVVSTCSSY